MPPTRAQFPFRSGTSLLLPAGSALLSADLAHVAVRVLPSRRRPVAAAPKPRNSGLASRLGGDVLSKRAGFRVRRSTARSVCPAFTQSRYSGRQAR
jgi:hypothetical protein